MFDCVIELDRITVRYPAERIRTLAERFRRRGAHEAREREVLHDVSLRIHSGEKVGLVGANGAGKTTLLRVAAGIVRPSSGRAIRRGSLAPLLALGTGFDPHLSGRANVYLSGALLGRSRREVTASLDEIIEFSGIGSFIDAPLRTYSSGMAARLAFAVTTAVDADTIMLDEILSVGDEEFRRRCEERMRSYARRGSAIVLVSHARDAMTQFCDRVIRLDRGRVVSDGPPSAFVDPRPPR